MECSRPGSSVLHRLLEFAQTDVYWVGGAIQPSHPLSSPSLLPSIFPSIRAFSSDQLFTSGGQSIGVSASTSVPPMTVQGWFPLGLTDLTSLVSKGLSWVFSSTTAWKHQFFSAQPSLRSDAHIHTWPLEKNIALTVRTLVDKVMALLFNMLSRFFNIRCN